MKNEVIKELIDRLYDYEGVSEYGCDLAYKLLESYNYDGTMTYSTAEAKKWIQNYFDEIGEVYEKLKGQGIIDNVNPFDEPEKFQVIIFMEASSYLIGKCNFIEKNWNNEITLNKKNIATIKKQLEALNDNGSIYSC